MNKVHHSAIFEAAATGSVVAVVNVFVALLLFLIDPTVLVIRTASNFLFVEFAIMLIIGGCLMSREPLSDVTDNASDANRGVHDVTFYKMAQLGRKLLLTSLFVFIFGALFALAG